MLVGVLIQILTMEKNSILLSDRNYSDFSLASYQKIKYKFPINSKLYNIFLVTRSDITYQGDN
jgi:hypothetical protein